MEVLRKQPSNSPASPQIACQELERDPAFYAFIGAILGGFILIFRMFANI